MEETLQDLTANRKQKLALLDQMMELMQKEKTQLLADEMEAVVETAKSWDALAQKVQTLDAAFQKESAKELPEKDEKATLKLETAAREKLLAMQALQEECNQIATGKMDKCKNDLKDMQKSNQRVNSYINPYTISEDGIYFDKKK